MKIIYLLLIIFASSFIIAQELEKKEDIEQRQRYLDNFFKENKVTNTEKLHIECELSYLFYQYQFEDKNIDEGIPNAFKSILDTYRNTKTIDYSHRIEGFEQRRNQIEAVRKANEGEKIIKRPKPSKDLPDIPNYDKASTCNNSDFEGGSLTGWQLRWGTNPGGGSSANINFNNGANSGAMNSTAGYHTLMGPGAGTDPRTNGNISRVYPGGGQYSMRLGDYNTGGRGAKASYTFVVTPQTELFIYHYAAVLQDPGHSVTQQPFLEINLTIGNQNDPCGYYKQAASANAPGYYNGSGNAKYKPWTSMSISLTQFMGQTVNIEFVAAGCSPTAHYGYAYIDAECLSMPSLTTTDINCFDPTPTVHGPPGATGYQWSGPGIIGANNTQNIIVNQPGSYNLSVIPVQGAQCAYTVQVLVTQHLGTISASYIPTPQQMCLSDPVSFQSSFTTTGTPGNIDIINWDFGDGNNSSNANPNHVYANPGVYQVALSVITEGGCTDTVTQDITVFPKPQADFTPTQICFGQDINFIDASTHPLGGLINSWHWDFDDGGTSNSQTPPPHQYASANNYNVTLNIIDTNGCTDVISKPVTVFPKPVVTAYPDTTICAGATVTLNSSGTNTFIWDNNLGAGANHSVTPMVTTVYEVIGTDLNGCMDTSIVTVTVNPKPVLTTSGDIDLCQGLSDIISASGADTYVWDNNLGAGSNHSISPNSTTTYQVIGTDINGCKDTSNLTVTVYSKPIVTTSSDTTVCNGTTVTLTAFGTNNFIWDNNLGVGNNHNVSPSNTTTYQVIGTDINGCKDTSDVTITVYPKPIINISADTTICQGETVIISSNGTNSFVWDNNLGAGNSHSVIPSITTTYQVIGTDLQTCKDTASVTVTVNQRPTVSTSPNLDLCDGSTAVISAFGANTYVWDNSLGAGSSHNITPTTSTSYQVIGTNIHGCKDTAQVFVNVKPNPVVFAPPDITICEGDNVTLVAINPTGANISWNNGVMDGVSFIPPVGTFNYVVTADKDGCPAYDNLTITVNKSPNIYVGQDIITCLGDKITLTASGAVNYVWDNGVMNNQLFEPPQGITTYTVTGTDAKGCKNTAQITVTVNTPGVASFSIDKDLGCAPLTVNFTNDVNGLSDGNCEFVISNGVSISGCNAAYTFTNGGCYDITLYITDSINGCVNKTTEQICVEPNPVASFNISPDYISEINNQIQFINTSKNADSYLWNFGDGSTSIDTKPRHIYSATLNEYHVNLIATSEFGCTDTASMIIPVQEELIYYIPNSFTPDWDNVNQVFKPIFTSGFDVRDYHFTVFNRWGEIMFESFNHEVGWDGSYGINNTKAVKEGTYIWKIEFKTKLNDERVVITGHVNLIK